LKAYAICRRRQALQRAWMYSAPLYVVTLLYGNVTPTQLAVITIAQQGAIAHNLVSDRRRRIRSAEEYARAVGAGSEPRRRLGLEFFAGIPARFVPWLDGGLILVLTIVLGRPWALDIASWDGALRALLLGTLCAWGIHNRVRWAATVQEEKTALDALARKGQTT
jgi:hypothetical protein